MTNCYMLCDASASVSMSAEPAAAGTEGAKSASAFSSAGPFVPMLLILAIFYFMMIRPQQRKEKERRRMIDELRAGSKVIFAGGIIGTIVEATEKTFKIETAAGTEMEVLRSSVQSVIPAEGEAAK